MGWQLCLRPPDERCWYLRDVIHHHVQGLLRRSRSSPVSQAGRNIPSQVHHFQLLARYTSGTHILWLGACFQTLSCTDVVDGRWVDGSFNVGLLFLTFIPNEDVIRFKKV